MLADPNQIKRYSDAEQALIQKKFKDGPVLYALRNLFWQIELTEDEKKLLNFNAEELKLIKKLMLPDIAGDIPLNQQVDQTTDPILDNISQMNPALALIMMDANDLMFEYLDQQFKKLVTGDLNITENDRYILKDFKKRLGVDQDEVRHINMLAYKSIKNYIDGRIFEFKYLSNPPVEQTPEQLREKARKDSTQ